MDLHLSIENGRIISNIYDKRDDFNFDIVNFPSLDGDVSRATSYGVYVSQLIRFARSCNKVEEFNIRNLSITNKLLHQGYRYHKLRTTFSKLYYRNPHLVANYHSNLKTLLRQGLSQPDFYGDVIYNLRKILGHIHFATLFVKRSKYFIKRGYDRAILQRTACLVIAPFTAGHYTLSFFYNCTMTGQVVDSMTTSGPV